MEAKYFNALLQVVMDPQLSLFNERKFERDALLRELFEHGVYIPVGQIEEEIGWGIGDTQYVDDNNNWIFGFLHKVVDASDISTIPPNANSLKEARNLDEGMINKTPFFFDFKRQHIYTQSHWRISRAPISSSKIWEKIITHVLKKHIRYVTVQPIPEGDSFWEQMQKLKAIHRAEFDLYGPNILNEERIRNLIKDLNPTDSNGIIVVLKNYLKGLKTETEEFKALISYVLKGGGKGIFKGPDKRTEKTRTVITEDKHEVILVI